MMMKKIKKLTAAIVSAAVLFCAPVTSMASDTAGSQAEEVIMENVDNLLSDPGQVADIVVYVKDLIDQQQITGDQIASGVDMASEALGISLTDSEKEAIVNVAQKVLAVDVDADALRSQIESVYDKMEELGIGKEEVKGFIQKVIDFAKTFLVKRENIRS